jgi:hypothetical protein
MYAVGVLSRNLLKKNRTSLEFCYNGWNCSYTDIAPF